MKMKNLKTLSIVSAITLMTSNSLPLLTFAKSSTKDSIGSINMEDDGVTIGVDETQTQKTEYSNEIESDGQQSANVYVSQASTFGVVIPKVIILDGKKNDQNINKANYVVKIVETSNYSGGEFVNVVPSESFTLSQLGKEDIEATITQDKEKWFINEIATPGNGEVSASGMSAGSWKGQFNFNIALKGNKVTIIAKDENGVDLNATLINITGDEKNNLLAQLVTSNYISNENEVDLLIDVQSDEFNGTSIATFDVSNIANVGDTVVLYHYDETNSTWEYIGTAIVAEDGTISGEFNSFSPVAFVVKPKTNVVTKEITISYDANNGGTGDSWFTKIKENEQATVSNYLFIANEYMEFLNWNTKQDGSGISYNVGENVSFKENTTLYAIYKINNSPTYIAKSNYAGKINEMSGPDTISIVISKGFNNFKAAGTRQCIGCKATLNVYNPACSTCGASIGIYLYEPIVANGLYTYKHSCGTTLQNTNIGTHSCRDTRKKSYNLNFNQNTSYPKNSKGENPSTSSGGTSGDKYEYGGTYVAPRINTWIGYITDNWMNTSTMKNGSTRYLTNGGTFYRLVADGGNMTLYARHIPYSYNITFNFNRPTADSKITINNKAISNNILSTSGKVNFDDYLSSVINNQYSFMDGTNLANINMENKTFKGWSTNPNGTGTLLTFNTRLNVVILNNVFGSVPSNDSNLTLYAIWK